MATEGFVAIDCPRANMRQVVAMNFLSTRQVAEQSSLSRATLERWIAAGKIRPSRTARVGGATVRYWTAADVERVREHKRRSYRKGRGRRRKREANVQ